MRLVTPIGLVVDALFVDREFLGGAGGELHFEAVGGGGLLRGLLVEQGVARAQRVLDDQGLGLLVDVAHGVGAGLLGGDLGGEHAAAGVDLAHDGLPCCRRPR